MLGQEAALSWVGEEARNLGNVGPYQFDGVNVICKMTWLISGKDNARAFIKHFEETNGKTQRE